MSVEPSGWPPQPSLTRLIGSSSLACIFSRLSHPTQSRWMHVSRGETPLVWSPPIRLLHRGRGGPDLATGSARPAAMRRCVCPGRGQLPAAAPGHQRGELEHGLNSVFAVGARMYELLSFSNFANFWFISSPHMRFQSDC